MPSELQTLQTTKTISETHPKNIRDHFYRPLHDLRISVIDRCNFRCNYCMPAQEYHESYSFLSQNDWLTFEEIVRLTKIFVSHGVSKIRITGGEPLLRENLSDLIKRLSIIDGIDDLALTTNGILLGKYAGHLKESGLQRITVSLDTLDEKIFQKMNGNKARVTGVLNGIQAALRVGFSPIKINAVVQKGVNDNSPLDLVRYFKGENYILRFIEYMDVGNRNHWNLHNVMPSGEILRRIEQEFPLMPLEANYHGEVAQRYGFADKTGEIGFVSSITQPFCGTCTRARLSTDGKFYTCLFAENGFDLRKPLRDGATDKDLSNLIADVWRAREDRYSETRLKTDPRKARPHKIEMYQIGG